MGFFSKVAGWIGNNWQGIANVGLGIANAVNSNKNTDKALAAQSAENQKMREHNEYLADKQNSANVAQWMRENAYNHPAAQKSRYEQAGFNADMMYGGGASSASAASPAMTGGAPAQSMDWSSLANKKTLGDAALDSLNRELMRTQIDKVKADTEKTLADAGLSKISLEYADAEKRLGLKMSEQQYENSKKDYELAVQAIQRGESELEGISLDNAYKAIRNAFESESFWNRNIMSNCLSNLKSQPNRLNMLPSIMRLSC